jgi:hypothetical protein
LRGRLVVYYVWNPTAKPKYVTVDHKQSSQS